MKYLIGPAIMVVVFGLMYLGQEARHQEEMTEALIKQSRESEIRGCYRMLFVLELNADIPMNSKEVKEKACANLYRLGEFQ